MAKSSNYLSVLCASAAVAATVLIHADDWPQWRGPNRDGISKELGWRADWPAEGPKQLWNSNVGVGWSSMAVAGGRVYTMGNVEETDSVICLDAESGKELWKHSYPCSSKDPNGYPGPRCTPTVDGDRVFTVSRQGHFFCLDAKTGKVLWSKDFQKDFAGKVPTWGFSGSPLVEGNLVFFEAGGSGASAVACDKTTGKIVWKQGDDGAGYASPIAFNRGGERVIAFFSATGLVGRKMKDGAEVFRFPWKTSYDVNSATPIIVGNKIFISSGYNTGGALVDVSGEPKEVWRNKEMRNHMNACVYKDGTLYGFDENNLKAVDFETGRKFWETRAYGKGSLIMAGDKLIVFGDSGRLALVEANPNAYKETAGAQVIGGKSTWAPPALANGRIYVRANDKLAAFDVAGKKVALNAGAAPKNDSGNGSSVEFQKLFQEEGAPKGWVVRAWNDVKDTPKEKSVWEVKDGVLHGSEPRGTWLVSEKEYGDFEIDFEWKIGPRGNSGFGIRFPSAGDPAFDGLELQMCDPRYYPDDQRPQIPASELTGGIYRVIAPKKDVFKPEAWNKYTVRCEGPKVRVVLNGELIQQVDLDQYTEKVKRHNGEDAPSLKDRPRKGRIGFQELSRGGAHVEIRNVRIRELR